MKDHQLRAWLKVVEVRSIRAAARSLHLSQAAVTKAIKELEAELDAPLLTRSSKGISITECGELLTVRARLADNQLNLARQDIRQLQGGVHAKVSVGVTPIVMLSVLPEVVREFRKTMPAARIKVVEGLLPAVLQALRGGTLDFAIAGRAEVSEDLYSFEPLVPFEFMIGCRTGHPLARAKRWSEVVDSEWLFNFTTGTQANSFLNGLRASGLPVPERVIECDTFGLFWTLMKRCDALQLCPTAILDVKPYSEQIRRISVDVPIPSADIGIMTLRDTPLSLAAERMASLFRRRMAQTKGLSAR